MARKFLYLIAAIIFLVLAAAVTYQLFPSWIARTAFVPTKDFVAQPAPKPNAYDHAILWLAKPSMEDNPANWRPTPAVPATPAAALRDSSPDASQSPSDEIVKPATGPAAVFFVHPTSYYSRSSWNAPLADRDADHRATLFVQGMATAFADAGEIWAPRYRQATIGAFLAQDRENADKAIEAAYLDVEQAFDAFLAGIDKNRPIILAGHSQGALHLTSLLNRRIAGTPLVGRLVAVYAIGWPISMDVDLPKLGLPACQTPEDKGCIFSYLSFAEPADPTMVLEAYDATTGFDGRSRSGTQIMCSNPISGIPDTIADPAMNIGTLKPAQDFRSGQLFTGSVGAACDPNNGLLMLGDANVVKDFVVAGYVLPGNNYHVYDITLFWGNLRRDSLRRLESYFQANPKSRPKPVTIASNITR